MSGENLNLSALYKELDWLSSVINHVIGCYLKQDGFDTQLNTIKPPNPHEDEDFTKSVYGTLVKDWGLDESERLALALSLAPHLRPEILDVFLGVNVVTQRNFSEFGGAVDKGFNGFLPTGQTLVFIISANNPLLKNAAISILSSEHKFADEQLICLTATEQGLPMLSGILTLSEQWLHYFLSGDKVRPELSDTFPASPITTPLSWSDLVLDYHVMVQIEEIRAWLEHGETLMNNWGLAKKIKPGYRAVFYGPPGTGKTLTAALLAKNTNRDIYRVDLSMIVSKYIGETEKNLSKVFDVASYKDWILFFDEADALFGKRTAASNSNDRHANQQTGYLLQRIEDFPGMVILATNLKANMDDAFTRRFQAMINFNMPPPKLRLQLWQNAFEGVCELDQDVDLTSIANEHELAGGAIINVLRQCALNAIKQNKTKVDQTDLMAGIKRELRKENRTIKYN